MRTIPWCIRQKYNWHTVEVGVRLLFMEYECTTALKSRRPSKTFIFYAVYSYGYTYVRREVTQSDGNPWSFLCNGDLSSAGVSVSVVSVYGAPTHRKTMQRISHTLKRNGNYVPKYTIFWKSSNLSILFKICNIRWKVFLCVHFWRKTYSRCMAKCTRSGAYQFLIRREHLHISHLASVIIVDVVARIRE